VSCDPASITDELNVYNFVRLNPIRMIDPSGRVPVEPTQRELELLQSIPEEHIAHLNTRDDTKHTKGNDSLPPGFEINPLVLREGPRGEGIIVRRYTYERERISNRMLSGVDNQASVGGTVGYIISSIITDDPDRQYAASGFGANVGLVTSSAAATVIAKAQIKSIGDSLVSRRPSTYQVSESAASEESPATTTEPTHIGTGSSSPRRISPYNPTGATDVCVACVSATISNIESGGFVDTAETIQRKFGSVKRLPSGEPNPLVSSIERSLGYIQGATTVTVDPKPVQGGFAAARKPGLYAIFVSNTHVVNARIFDNGRKVINDTAIAKGWSTWQAFESYISSKPGIYGKNPSFKTYHINQ